MGNSIINWIEQWLNDTKQRVVVDGEVSSWKSVLTRLYVREYFFFQEDHHCMEYIFLEINPPGALRV